MRVSSTVRIIPVSSLILSRKLIVSEIKKDLFNETVIDKRPVVGQIDVDCAWCGKNLGKSCHSIGIVPATNFSFALLVFLD